MVVAPYDSKFFSAQASGSLRSAREVISVVREMIEPRSVVDVGCGVGTWLKVWQDLGVEKTLGIDGDYVQADQLLIPQDRFRPMNLSTPTKLETYFDLVESLEVAEHLSESSADGFVSFLCSLGKVILFSAAIPLQEGTHHINEQWPEYWAELFLSKGYVPIDGIRDRIWNNPNVDSWYCQNTLIFVEAQHRATLPGLQALPVVPPHGPPARVHPRQWMARNERASHLEKLLKALPQGVYHFPIRLMRKLRGPSAR